MTATDCSRDCGFHQPPIFLPFFFSKKTHASCTYKNYIFKLTWNWQQVSTKVSERPSVICLPPSKAKDMSLMEDDSALWTFFICYTFCTTILIRLKKPNALGGYKIENYHIFIPTWMSGNGRVEHVSLFPHESQYSGTGAGCVTTWKARERSSFNMKAARTLKDTQNRYVSLGWRDLNSFLSSLNKQNFADNGSSVPTSCLLPLCEVCLSV